MRSDILRRETGLSAPRLLAIFIAALAMVATLPGRTHGLGLITEPLLADLELSRLSYAAINLWATLLGAAFCLPCGWLLDRLGARVVCFAVVAGLGATVVGMSALPAGGTWGVVAGLFVLVLLTRGLGQSALSVVSLALMGKSQGRRGALAVGVYSFLVAVGFMAAFSLVKYALEGWHLGWRSLWAGIGWQLLILSVPMALLARPPAEELAVQEETGMTLGQSLRTPAFWAFALATCLYSVIAAGISLFNQSILAERNFGREVFLNITILGPLVGLASNLTAGWLGRFYPMGRLLAAALWLLAVALACFPLVTELWHVYAYAVAMGAAGGVVTVAFFGVWRPAFGAAHLGQIQGAAQMLTVLASALGPLLLAWCQEQTGSYVLVFRCAALLGVVLGVACWIVPMPRLAAGVLRNEGDSVRPAEGQA